MRRCCAFRALTTWLTGMCRVRFQKRDSYIANVSDLLTMDWVQLHCIQEKNSTWTLWLHFLVLITMSCLFLSLRSCAWILKHKQNSLLTFIEFILYFTRLSCIVFQSVSFLTFYQVALNSLGVEKSQKQTLTDDQIPTWHVCLNFHAFYVVDILFIVFLRYSVLEKSYCSLFLILESIQCPGRLNVF